MVARMFGVWRTSDPPVRRLVDRMQAMERTEPSVLSVSFLSRLSLG